MIKAHIAGTKRKQDITWAERKVHCSPHTCSAGLCLTTKKKRVTAYTGVMSSHPHDYHGLQPHRITGSEYSLGFLVLLFYKLVKDENSEIV